MVQILSGDDQLKRLFAGLIENTFHTEIGIADPSLVDYLTNLLMRFVRHESVFKIRDLRGKRIEEVAQMVLEAEQSADRPKREIHRHIGDFTLFWSGVYPEALKVLRGFDRSDHLVNYREQGKRSYLIASSYEQDPYAEEAPILRQLSDLFDIATKGLYAVRCQWEMN